MKCLYSDIISPCSETDGGQTKFDMYAMFKYDFLKQDYPRNKALYR